MQYYGIHPRSNKNIIKIARRVRKKMRHENSDFPVGYCWDASRELFGELCSQGIKSELVKGCFWCVRDSKRIRGDFNTHWFIKIKNKFLDITGDQFNQRLKNLEQSLRVNQVVFDYVSYLDRYEVSRH